MGPFDPCITSNQFSCFQPCPSPLLSEICSASNSCIFPGFYSKYTFVYYWLLPLSHLTFTFLRYPLHHHVPQGPSVFHLPILLFVPPSPPHHQVTSHQPLLQIYHTCFHFPYLYLLPRSHLLLSLTCSFGRLPTLTLDNTLTLIFPICSVPLHTSTPKSPVIHLLSGSMF